MKKTTPFSLTREKHLDHMVKVVPFIVMGYAIQCYVLMQMSEQLGTTSVFILGGSLIAMIAAFITYDIKHQVTFFDDHLEIKFLFLKKTIFYKDITKVQISEAKQTFANVRITSHKSTAALFFVDDADGVKEFLENTQKTEDQLAA